MAARLCLILLGISTNRIRARDSQAFSTSYSKQAPSYASGKDWPTRANALAVTVAVDTESTRVANPYVYGTNLPIYIGSEFAADTVAEAVSTAGFSLLRFPGGSPANKYLFDDSYDKYPYFEQYSWMSASGQYGIDDFINLVKTTGAEPIVELNAALCLMYGAEAGIENALQEYAYFASKGVTVKYWEYGNENYGSWEPPDDTYGNVTGANYGACFNAVYDNFTATYPDTYLGAVAYQSASSSIPNYMEDMLSVGVADRADFFILHNYFYTGSETPSDEDLFATMSDLKGYADSLTTLIETYAPGVTPPPYALTEFSIVMESKAGCGATLQFINSLWTAELLGENQLGGYFAAANAFALANSNYTCKTGDTGRGSYSDYGVLSRDYPTTNAEPAPQYYTYALFDLAFGETVYNATSSDDSLLAYASQFSGGEIGLVLINKDASNAREVAVNAVATALSCDTNVLVNGWIINSGVSGDLSATSAKWNGISNALNKSSTNTLSEYAPYSMSASVSSGSVNLTVPAGSVLGAVLYTCSSDGLSESSKRKRLRGRASSREIRRHVQLEGEGEEEMMSTVMLQTSMDSDLVEDKKVAIEL
eukprot:TRINITY_DN46329_c0_g1_i1.p1 TRINITY_DN46329_c0_g1~~TRINITY_DN46329_c0_g1_i1.p1  ORF type:complete len:595 (+),score=57.03 TRINITY_DN46329_c0_g1_i1:43-1827(+)